MSVEGWGDGSGGGQTNAVVLHNVRRWNATACIIWKELLENVVRADHAILAQQIGQQKRRGHLESRSAGFGF